MGKKNRSKGGNKKSKKNKGLVQRSIEVREMYDARMKKMQREEKMQKEKKKKMDAKRSTIEMKDLVGDKYKKSKRKFYLLVGEGNFSFALALHKKIKENKGKACIVATCFDSEEELVEKYGEEVKTAIAYLRKNGIIVIDKIDATKLESYPTLQMKMNKKSGKITSANEINQSSKDNNNGDDDEDQYEENQGYNYDQDDDENGDVDVKFDRVIFNFPHLGAGIKNRSKNIEAHQVLISKFFKSARKMLAVDRLGEIRVALKTGSPYDDWKIHLIGQNNQLSLKHAVPFSSKLWPGYKHCRTKGSHYRDRESDGNEDDNGEEGNVDIDKGAKVYVFRDAKYAQVKEEINNRKKEMMMDDY